MADFFRVQLGIVSRSDGHSAAKRSAYQACGKAVDHEGRLFDFSRKHKEHVRTIMLGAETAPDWTREADLLWQRAAEAEKRIDAQEARIVDFSMPRQVPQALWEDCIRHAYAPLIARGMIFQIDIHNTPASDGGRNVNIHGLATLRPVDGNGFSARKDRTWNDLFRERGGRTVREMFAARLTSFCQEHGIAYQGDARPNAERELPDPEPQLPRWNFEAHARTQDMTEALTALHEHRKTRREWEAAQAEEVEAALELSRLETRLRNQRQQRIVSAATGQRPTSMGDRRAAILRAWHKSGWIDADTIPAIASVRLDQTRDLLWINLADGTTLIDRGDEITLRGRVTWPAALETAAAAERHGWASVQVHGDQAYKDAVTIACLLRGIDVENHTLSPKAQAALNQMLAERVVHSKNPNELPAISTETTVASQATVSVCSSRDIQLRLARRNSFEVSASTEPLEADDSASISKPAFVPRPPSGNPRSEKSSL